MITLDDFKKLELRVATIRDVADHPNADRLFVLQVDLGDRSKQIVAGIKKGYNREELIGRQIVIIDNLEPALLRGVESQGMLLAASDEETIAVLSPGKTVKPGSVVK